MLRDFLAGCECALPEEAGDLARVKEALSGVTETAFMPAVWPDLYPVYALSRTGARRLVSPRVFIVPAGAHGDLGLRVFEDLVRRFYREDVIPENADAYGAELEETLLLVHPAAEEAFSLKDTRYSVLYCRVSFGGEEAHLLLTPQSPEACWKRIMEAYGIPCSVLIDSHKGMESWYDSVPLFGAMRDTRTPGLLPRYYFRGRFISRGPGRGFRLVYTIPESIRGVGDFEKEIYEIDWEELKRAAAEPEGTVTAP